MLGVQSLRLHCVPRLAFRSSFRRAACRSSPSGWHANAMNSPLGFPLSERMSARTRRGVKSSGFSTISWCKACSMERGLPMVATAPLHEPFYATESFIHSLLHRTDDVPDQPLWGLVGVHIEGVEHVLQVVDQVFDQLLKPP